MWPCQIYLSGVSFSYQIKSQITVLPHSDGTLTKIRSCRASQPPKPISVRQFPSPVSTVRHSSLSTFQLSSMVLWILACSSLLWTQNISRSHAENLFPKNFACGFFWTESSFPDFSYLIKRDACNYICIIVPSRKVYFFLRICCLLSIFWEWNLFAHKIQVLIISIWCCVWLCV